jgi:uncharacterized protein YjdB
MTTSVTWSSANTSIATISNVDGSRGLATAIAAGQATNIRATDPATNTVGSTTINVS